jgi:hypothetical protein
MADRGGIKSFYLKKVFFEINIQKDIYEDNPYYKEDYYSKNKAIIGDGQYIKVQYIKVPSWKLCTPFINKCIYGKDKDNKIIKLWVKPYK